MGSKSAEQFELLSMTSSGSDSSITTVPEVYKVRKRIDLKRRCERIERKGTLHSLFNTQCVLLAVVCLLIIWLTTLSFMAFNLQRTTTELHKLSLSVVAGTQTVPEEIQQCHSLTRQLQNNQTQIFSQLSTMSLKINNFTNLISVVQEGLANVQNKLQEFPELINVPHDLQALSSSVAKFESTIQDLQSQSTHLKTQDETIQQFVKVIKSNITDLKEENEEFKDQIQNKVVNTNTMNNNISSDPSLKVVLEKLSPNISSINETLFHRLEWALEDQKTDHKNIMSLQDNYKNMSTHLLSLQNDFTAHESNANVIARNISEIIAKVQSSETKLEQIANIAKTVDKLTRTMESLNATIMQIPITNSKTDQLIISPHSSP